MLALQVLGPIITEISYLRGKTLKMNEKNAIAFW